MELLFAVGFLFGLVVLLVLAAYTVDAGAWFGALLVLLLFSAYFWLSLGVNAFAYAWANPLLSIFYAFAYLTLGLLWTIAKWLLYVRAEVKGLTSEVREQYASRDMEHLSKYTFVEWLYYSKRLSRAKDNEGLIACWVILWPVSIVWTLVDSYVREVITWLVTIYDRISNKVVERYIGKV